MIDKRGYSLTTSVWTHPSAAPPSESHRIFNYSSGFRSRIRTVVPLSSLATSSP